MADTLAPAVRARLEHLTRWGFVGHKDYEDRFPAQLEADVRALLAERDALAAASDQAQAARAAWVTAETQVAAWAALGQLILGPHGHLLSCPVPVAPASGCHPICAALRAALAPPAEGGADGG